MFFEGEGNKIDDFSARGDNTPDAIGRGVVAESASLSRLVCYYVFT